MNDAEWMAKYWQVDKPTLAFEQPHFFTVPKVDDEFFTWRTDSELAVNRGPVFPYFLDTDFESYDGFREFTNLFGFEGFFAFSPALEKECNKGLHTMTRAFIHETVFRQIKHRLLHEQRILRNLKDLLFDSSADRRKFANPLFDEGIHALADGIDNEDGAELIQATKENIGGIRIRLLAETFLQTHMVLMAEATPRPLIKNIPVVYGFPDIVSRCYLELLDVFNHGRKPKECENCHHLFLPKTANEKYCERLDPSASCFRPSQTPTIGGYVVSDAKELIGFDPDITKWTCRERGRLARWKKNLTPSEKKYQREKRKRLNRVNYLARTYDKKSERYKVEKADYDKWMEKNKPKRKKKRSD